MLCDWVHSYLVHNKLQIHSSPDQDKTVTEDNTCMNEWRVKSQGSQHRPSGRPAVWTQRPSLASPNTHSCRLFIIFFFTFRKLARRLQTRSVQLDCVPAGQNNQRWGCYFHMKLEMKAKYPKRLRNQLIMFGQRQKWDACEVFLSVCIGNGFTVVRTHFWSAASAICGHYANSAHGKKTIFVSITRIGDLIGISFPISPCTPQEITCTWVTLMSYEHWY